MFNNNEPSSPWLKSEKRLNSNSAASFVEYLRWMRSPDADEIDKTKVQILQMAAEKSTGYRERLRELNQRTTLIAGEENTFTVECPWRLRVGGHRGPESLLLPAFDALGMPYIPSSTLRGVARNQGIRHFLRNGMNWQQATQEIARYFGSIETKKDCDRSGKVIFLDAYPTSNQGSLLAVDMANNIWSWEGNSIKYKPNPNPFLSLKQPTFLIGIRRTARCDEDTYNQIRTWLIQGLEAGIGSQVNTGYGELIQRGRTNNHELLFQVQFTIIGQLIHGSQRLTWDNQERKYKIEPQAEIRPVAFKSMLRYWFRVFALGFLSADKVKHWEHNLFGSLQFQSQGWLKFQIKTISNPRSSIQDENTPCLQQRGLLKVSFSEEVPQSQTDQTTISNLLKNLTWMMFHLGGIGQGARRPLYSRQNRHNGKPPWYRGVQLRADPDDLFQELPPTPQEFQQLFQQRIEEFYRALDQMTRNQINLRSPLTTTPASGQDWSEVVDKNCQIIVCSGSYNQQSGKPHALAVLHDESLKNRGNYDSNICGKQGDRSPIWIAGLDHYQVVTVFGANERHRQNFIRLLKQTSESNYAEIWKIRQIAS